MDYLENFSLSMKISVITVCRNSELTLQQTFDSIRKQTFKNIEYIVVDGKSDDNSLKIIQQNSDIISKLISEPDKGIFDAMNKGISIASGDVIGFLNSDDIYADNTILDLISNELSSANVDAVCGDISYFTSNPNKIIRKWKSSPYKVNGFLKGWQPTHPTFYAKKNFYDSLGPYKIEFGISADFELMFRFVEVNKIRISYIPKVLIKMRFGGASTGSIKGIVEGYRQVLRIFQAYNLKPYPFYFFRRMFPKFIEFFRR